MDENPFASPQSTDEFTRVFTSPGWQARVVQELKRTNVWMIMFEIIVVIPLLGAAASAVFSSEIEPGLLPICIYVAIAAALLFTTAQRSRIFQKAPSVENLERLMRVQNVFGAMIAYPGIVISMCYVLSMLVTLQSLMSGTLDALSG